MDWPLLFSMQKELDERIKAEHQLENTDVINDKLLALFVEIGELANETRCFKFWSQKGPSDQMTILEEYVDGLHFIISIGIELGYSSFDHVKSQKPGQTTDVFLQVYEKILMFKSNKSKESYNDLFTSFLSLGQQLGFDEEMIQRAYRNKNEVNHQRQDEGY